MGEEIVWIIVGLVLIVAELFLTSFVVVFLGIGALVTGILLWAGLPTAGGTPFVVFSGVSVGLLVFLRRKFQQWFRGASIAGGSDDDIIGHEATIQSGFDTASPTRGKVSYRGAGWDARSHSGPLAQGAFVRIVARQGLVLEVTPSTSSTSTGEQDRTAP